MSKYVKKADRDRIPGGPLARHGGYSVAHKDEIIRRRPEIRLYLKVVRRGLIRDICPEGEEHMTTARHIVLDRLMQKLATARLIEEYLAEHGILKPRANRKLLEAQHITTLWLALNNQIREDLKLLGLDRKPLDAALDIHAYIAEFDRKKADTQADEGQDGQSSADQGDPAQDMGGGAIVATDDAGATSTGKDTKETTPSEGSKINTKEKTMLSMVKSSQTIFVGAIVANSDALLYTLWKVPHAIRILAIRLGVDADCAAADTNYNTFQVKNGSVVVATIANGPVATGTSFAKGTFSDMTLAASPDFELVAGDVLTLKVTKTGTGLALAGAVMQIEHQPN